MTMNSNISRLFCFAAFVLSACFCPNLVSAGEQPKLVHLQLYTRGPGLDDIELRLNGVIVAKHAACYEATRTITANAEWTDLILIGYRTWTSSEDFYSEEWKNTLREIGSSTGHPRVIIYKIRDEQVPIDDVLAVWVGADVGNGKKVCVYSSSQEFATYMAGEEKIAFAEVKNGYRLIIVADPSQDPINIGNDPSFSKLFRSEGTTIIQGKQGNQLR